MSHVETSSLNNLQNNTKYRYKYITNYYLYNKLHYLNSSLLMSYLFLSKSIHNKYNNLLTSYVPYHIKLKFISKLNFKNYLYIKNHTFISEEFINFNSKLNELNIGNILTKPIFSFIFNYFTYYKLNLSKIIKNKKEKKKFKYNPYYFAYSDFIRKLKIQIQNEKKKKYYKVSNLKKYELKLSRKDKIKFRNKFRFNKNSNNILFGFKLPFKFNKKKIKIRKDVSLKFKLLLKNKLLHSLKKEYKRKKKHTKLRNIYNAKLFNITARTKSKSKFRKYNKIITKLNKIKYSLKHKLFNLRNFCMKHISCLKNKTTSITPYFYIKHLLNNYELKLTKISNHQKKYYFYIFIRRYIFKLKNYMQKLVQNKNRIIMYFISLLKFIKILIFSNNFKTKLYTLRYLLKNNIPKQIIYLVLYKVNSYESYFLKKQNRFLFNLFFYMYLLTKRNKLHDQSVKPLIRYAVNNIQQAKILETMFFNLFKFQKKKFQ